MKRIILSLSLVLLSLSSFAVEISGRVLEKSNQSPMQFVTVAVLNKTTQTSVGGALTNELGFFSINAIPNGEYVLKVTYIGYKTILREIKVNTQKLAIGSLQMEEDEKTLKEVEVVGQGSQMRFDIDKKVFSVDQNIASSGGSATEALQSIPSVNVDNEGNISLRNNENVEIWINGRPSGLTADNRAQVLQQLPAGSLESIEVMTNPSAKFSPEGTAGIINLVMKKDRKAGYYGSVGAGLNLGNGNKLGGSTNASINYSSNKLDAYANLGYRNMAMLRESFTNRTNYNNGDTTDLDQRESGVRSFKGLFLRGGIDYHLNDKNTIGFSGFGMSGSMGNNSDVDYLLTRRSTAATKAKYSRNNLSDGNHNGYHLSLYHKIDFDDLGSNLTTSLLASAHDMSSKNTYTETKTVPIVENSNISQDADNYNNHYELKIDFTKKFNENDRLELGWNSNFQRRRSTSDGYDNIANSPLDVYYNKFTDDEWIHAFYFTYGKKMNNFTTQVGLRVEDLFKTTTTVQTSGTSSYPKDGDLQLFPSLYLTYSLPNNNELQLNYSRRVNRPRGRQLNSFRDYSDPTLVSFGNPNLNSEYASVVELNYLKNWDSHALSTSAYYHFTDNVVQNVTYLNDAIMESTYMNLTKKQDAGLEIVAKDRLFKALNLTTSLNLYYSKINSSVYTTSNNQDIYIPGQSNFTWDAKLIANFMLSRTLSGQMTAQYLAPQVIGQGTRYEMYTMDFGLRKTFMDKRWTVTLTGRDIFNSKRLKTKTSGAGFIQTYESLMGGRMGGGRMLGVNVTYSFGNMKPKKQDMQKMQNSDSEMGGMED